MNAELVSAILFVLLSLSEALGTFKIFADNSIFQLIVRIIKLIYQMLTGKAAAPKPATV